MSAQTFPPHPPLPVAPTGVGLRAPHMQDVLSRKPKVGFLEAHSENYFGATRERQQLLTLREDYAISLHGVGLSLGRADGLEARHLQEIRSLVQDVDPLFVSEHISWSAFNGQHVPDLLPLPMTTEALDTIASHIQVFQETVGRQILVENPSSYLRFSLQDMTETEFLTQLVRKTGCGLLLDINNIYVSSHNIGFDAHAYLQAVPAAAVQELHIAGYQENDIGDGQQMYIDTHGKPVYPPVWDLYAEALNILGDTTTLMEWDTDIPPLDVLLAEAQKADEIRMHRNDLPTGKDAHAAAG